jgi:SAM-dependent methyltransferase
MAQASMAQNCYTGLEAELYDLWFAIPSSEEYAFYKYFMDTVPGLALEIGCGTGRLLIPYLQQGLPVEGLDCSASMLERCKAKAHQLNLSPILYQQHMQFLDIPQHYTTVYIPFCSFMLISNRTEAVQALKHFYDHIVDKGQLIISLFMPLHEASWSHAANWRVKRQKIRSSDGALALCSESLTYQPFEQLRHGLLRYELYKDGQLLESQLTCQDIRWYSKYEFIMMLEHAGFCDIELYGDYTFEEASDYHETSIFRARKHMQYPP